MRYSGDGRDGGCPGGGGGGGGGYWQRQWYFYGGRKVRKDSLERGVEIVLLIYFVAAAICVLCCCCRHLEGNAINRSESEANSCFCHNFLILHEYLIELFIFPRKVLCSIRIFVPLGELKGI